MNEQELINKVNKVGNEVLDFIKKGSGNAKTDLPFLKENKEKFKEWADVFYQISVVKKSEPGRDKYIKEIKDLVTKNPKVYGETFYDGCIIVAWADFMKKLTTLDLDMEHQIILGIPIVNSMLQEEPEEK